MKRYFLFGIIFLFLAFFFVKLPQHIFALTQGNCPRSGEYCPLDNGGSCSACPAGTVKSSYQGTSTPDASCVSYTDTVNQDNCGTLCLGGTCVFTAPCCVPYSYPTCNSSTGGYCTTGGDFCTQRDYTYASSTYECAFSCCRPIQCSDLSDLSGACSNNFNTCPNGKTETYADSAATNTCNTGLCCTTTQNCNGGSRAQGTCHVNAMGANTCGDPGGYQNDYNTTYVHPLCGQANTAGNGYTCTPSTACYNVANGGTSFCDPGFQNNCNAGAGYTCVNQNTCVTSIFVHVYTDYNHTATNNGGGKQGVTVTDNGGNFIQTDASGNVTFTGKATGNYTITETVPANFQATNASSQGISLTNTSGNATVNFYLTPLYSISGRVFYDQNHNTHYDGSDSGFGGGTITVGGVGNFPVAPDGTWATNTTLLSGTYTVTYSSSLPSGYSFTTNSTYTITVGNPAGTPACSGGGNPDATCGGTNGGSEGNVDIGIDEPYQISGTVFNDTNKNGKYDTGTESPYTNGGTITLSGPTNATETVNGSGVYTTGQILLPGSYTVTYTSALAPGYTFTTSSTWVVSVGGTTCNPGSSLDASCGNPNSGSVNNLNFGVTNENPWLQSACLDIRNDSGSYTDLIPAAPSCGGVSGAYNIVTNGSCATGAGIVFTCTATGDFGLGSPNAQNWTAGGTGGNQECFTGAGLDVVRTSYSYLETTAQQSGITPIDLSTVCTLTNCTLPSSLTPGVYQANSNVNLNAYTFPSGASPEAFIFLINGNLTINGNILIPAGSVAAFSTSGDINVAASVGNAVTNPSDSSVNNPNIEGLYSADGNVVIHSFSETNGGQTCQASGAPYDNKLNIVGSVITNAALGGGSLTNNRDLCIYDTSCSSLSLGDNSGLATAYLLTLYENGQFLNHKLFAWQELKP